MNEKEKFGSPELDPRRRPCVSIDFGGSVHKGEYVLVLRPDGIYGRAVDIPSDWQNAFSEQLGREWSVMDRGSRFEIKPPLMGEGIDAWPTRTDETDRMVEGVLRLLLGEKFELIFSPSKK